MAIDPTANQATTTWVSDFGRSTPSSSTKIQPPNRVDLSSDGLAVEAMVEMVFQDIGGQELINISRADSINGQNIMYSIVKNLKNIMIDYNSNNIIKLIGTSDLYFKNFSIRLEERLATKGTGPNEETIYIESDTGNLVINLVNLEDEEQVEIEIINQGGYFDDTITSEV
jgi:hypothetical protein